MSLELSVVATVFNDEEAISYFVDELVPILESVTADYELILVDDCSTDDTYKIAVNYCKQNTKIKCIRMARNHGQQVAISAGMHNASGQYIVIIDGDGQNPPDVIPEIVDRLKSGLDVVYTVSKTRNNIFDRITSEIFWWIMIRGLGVNLIKNQLMLKGFSQKFLKYFKTYNERVRFVAGIVYDIGLSSSTIEVENRKRQKGKSHYSVFKRIDLMLNVIINLGSRLLDYLIYLGGIGLFFTFSMIGFYLYYYFAHGDLPPGFLSIISVVLIFGCTNVIMLGILGRFLSNIYLETKNRPLYLIGEKFNLGDD